MERVVTINLNGNPYQIEEPAYEALHAYISRAEAALRGNPDKAEIVRDLEQAIAEKCAAYLGPGKTVVGASEMGTILEEMGPVEGESDAAPEAQGTGAQGPGAQGAGPAGEAPRKRLYRIRDGAMIAGICSGLAAYLSVDVTVVRVLMVIGGFITGGWLLLAYLIAMFVIPSADTGEEWAAAHGVPFNAQEVIDRAKREYARFAEESAPRWRAEMRRQRREWRTRMRRWRFGPLADPATAAPAIPPAQPAGYLTRVIAGLLALIFSVVAAVLLIGFLVTLFGLLHAGSFFGWAPPIAMPLWLAIAVLCIAYVALAAPLKALRRASYTTVTGTRRGEGGDATIALIGVALLLGWLFLGWLAWLYVPEARTLMEHAHLGIRDFADHVAAFWR